MPEPTNFSAGTSGAPDPLFQEPRRERSFPTAAVAIAAVVVVVAVVVLLLTGRHTAAPAPTTEQPAAAYASSLVLSDLQMSQSESLSGGRSTYLDGHIVNQGSQTVTGATVQALFATGDGPTQILATPLSIVRTRQPYVDTETLATAPLEPGAQADFRLIFEGVSDSWDQKAPELRIIRIATK